MDTLPFKVRKKNPEVIYVTKDTILPKAVVEDRLNADALNYRGKIYLFKKRIPKYTMEHEKSHVELGETKPRTPKGVVAWLEDEVKADLLTYQKTGEPKHIYDRMESRACDVRMYHLDSKVVNYNYYEQTKHTVGHMEDAYRKYWTYLPEAWKKDVVKFLEISQRNLEKMRLQGKNLNPPKDYYLRWLKGGDYEVTRPKIVKKRDDVTGFIVKGVK